LQLQKNKEIDQGFDSMNKSGHRNKKRLYPKERKRVRVLGTIKEMARQQKSVEKLRKQNKSNKYF
jgi:hypothetical protein